LKTSPSPNTPLGFPHAHRTCRTALPKNPAGWPGTFNCAAVRLILNERAAVAREVAHPTHGPYFSLGRWGLPVNPLAVIFQVGVMVNVAWPRPAVYGAFVGLLGGLGTLYYFIALRGRAGTVSPEHRASVAAAAGIHAVADGA
jgi:hypothetical protein